MKPLAISGALLAAVLLYFQSPVDAAPAASDTYSLEAFASQNDCVMADQLVITFDDGTTETSAPSCEKAAPGDLALKASRSPEAAAELIFFFTSGRPNFSRTDSQGTFHAQRTITAGYPVAMSYSISPALRAIATSPAAVDFNRTPTYCRYLKTASVSYFFHWSCRGHTLQKVYKETGSLGFRVSVGGRSGSAVINVYFNYRHTLV